MGSRDSIGKWCRGSSGSRQLTAAPSIAPSSDCIPAPPPSSVTDSAAAPGSQQHSCDDPLFSAFVEVGACGLLYNVLLLCYRFVQTFFLLVDHLTGSEQNRMSAGRVRTLLSRSVSVIPTLSLS
ncbi:hypothetical protein BCV70DRAFT_50726 [Testicularia cyperi]|uniref:Uncharacterized protein n=1 Tax=Testicularia cyperi TaxID=1882483 RepID=A0A317XI58_9BASI|nr:hypothetical protein BCV70DRAFT_50726 [Testicularia cyperi]